MDRLADVGFRLNLAAAPLCSTSAAGTGIVLDHIEAYSPADRDAVRALLSMTDAPQIAALAMNSPASRAGTRVGDDILAIDGQLTSDLLAASPDRSIFADELETRLALTPPGRMIHLLLRRDSRSFEVEIAPVRTCSARFVIKTDKGFDAFSDGKNVALSRKLIDFARNDDELALIAGHELGHIVNKDGDAHSLGERRNMEDRADLLGADLARCAGYDLQAGVEFWLRRGRQDPFRMFRAPTHRKPEDRVALMREKAMTGPCPPNEVK